MTHEDEAPQHDPKETIQEKATDQFTSDKVEREIPDREEKVTIEEPDDEG